MADFSNGSLETYLKMPRVKAGNAVVLSQIQPAIDAAAKYGTLERSFSARELIDPNITAR